MRGAKKLAQAKPLRVRHSIVGEPTSLKPIRAGKGYSLAEVIVKGREAHSAYPALGASAVFRAARLIVRLESIAEQLSLSVKTIESYRARLLKKLGLRSRADITRYAVEMGLVGRRDQPETAVVP